jgi:GH18 family chitinase
LADGPNYLAFLKKLKMIFPREKTVAIAAPASYYYLRVFPLAEMWPYLDYIVYMTYDLHGENTWSFSGDTLTLFQGNGTMATLFSTGVRWEIACEVMVCPTRSKQDGKLTK